MNTEKHYAQRGSKVSESGGCDGAQPSIAEQSFAQRDSKVSESPESDGAYGHMGRRLRKATIRLLNGTPKSRSHRKTMGRMGRMGRVGRMGVSSKNPIRHLLNSSLISRKCKERE